MVVLTSIHVTNFRALRDVTLELAPLTVLVGPNASGKSSVLRALDPEFLHPFDLWRHDRNLSATVRYVEGPGTGAATGLATWGVQHSNWGDRPYSFQLLRLDVDELRKETRLEAETMLSASGAGIANVFAALPRNQQTEVSRRYCSLVPVFQDVDTQAVGGGAHELRFQDRWDKQLWYRPREVSDGSILLLAYLLVDFQMPRPSLLAVEEPERALHPYLLGELISLLRGLTAKPKEPIQVVLATHSAEILDHLRPEEVRFLTKNEEDGSVEIEQVSVSDPHWDAAWKAHQESLGGVWLSGGLGGVPAL